MSDLHESLSANETLTELIDNNERILEKRIRNTMIDRFIESLANSKSHKLVQILRAVCINDGRPMKKHQQYITQQMLLDAQKSEQLIKIEKRKQQNLEIYILAHFLVPIAKKESLNRFTETSE